jgi:hypothetical protein
MTEPPKCGTCHACFKNPHAINQGTCKGGPPMPIVLPARAGAVDVKFAWPNVGTNDVGCTIHQDWAAYVEARAASAAEHGSALAV